VARISGVDIPRDKRVEISLRYIYGIGSSNSREILAKARVSPDTRVKELTEEEVSRIRANARTKRGPRKTVAGRRRAVAKK